MWKQAQMMNSSNMNFYDWWYYQYIFQLGVGDILVDTIKRKDYFDYRLNRGYMPTSVSLMWLRKNELSQGVIRSVAHAQHPIGSALN